MKSEGRGKRLLIGEAAKLLGISTKAVRHYEKLGVLGEPERSDAGYRLFSADDLLRLHRIKRLRSLGLSLERIRGILGEKRSGSDLRPVLEALLGEIEIQIESLEARRSRLREAIEKEDPEADDGEPYALRLAEKHLGEGFARASSEETEGAKKVWMNLDSFAWPEGYRDTLDLLFRHYAGLSEEDRGEAYELERRFAALAEEPEDSPEVERLVENHMEFDARNPLPKELESSGMTGATGEVFAELLGANFSTAQKRFVELIEKRYEVRRKGGEK